MSSLGKLGPKSQGGIPAPKTDTPITIEVVENVIYAGLGYETKVMPINTDAVAGDYVYMSKDGNSIVSTKDINYFARNSSTGYTNMTRYKKYKESNTGNTGSYNNRLKHSTSSRKSAMRFDAGGSWPYNGVAIVDENGNTIATATSSYQNSANPIYNTAQSAISPDGTKYALYSVEYNGTNGSLLSVLLVNGTRYTHSSAGTIGTSVQDMAINNNGDIYFINNSSICYFNLNTSNNTFGYSGIGSSGQDGTNFIIALNNGNFLAKFYDGSYRVALYTINPVSKTVVTSNISTPFGDSSNRLYSLKELMSGKILCCGENSIYEYDINTNTFSSIISTISNISGFSFYGAEASQDKDTGNILLSSRTYNYGTYLICDSSYNILQISTSVSLGCTRNMFFGKKGTIFGYPSEATYVPTGVYIPTNNLEYYLAGIALTSATLLESDVAKDITVQTSGIKTTAVDFRSVGGVALMTSAIGK